MIGGVTHHMLPHLSGAPHLLLNDPNYLFINCRIPCIWSRKTEGNIYKLCFSQNFWWPYCMLSRGWHVDQHLPPCLQMNFAIALDCPRIFPSGVIINGIWPRGGLPAVSPKKKIEQRIKRVKWLQTNLIRVRIWWVPFSLRFFSFLLFLLFFSFIFHFRYNSFVMFLYIAHNFWLTNFLLGFT